jgi:hypothetical protein
MTEKVMAAIDGAWLVHMAAHGTFRADSPLFSAIELDDGPLTVYDLERLRRAPRTPSSRSGREPEREPSQSKARCTVTHSVIHPVSTSAPPSVRQRSRNGLAGMGSTVK